MGRYSYKGGLECLVEYAKGEGFKTVKLDHDKTSYVNWKRESLNDPSVIRIEGKYSAEVKVYLFLHELGHHELRKDWDSFRVEFPVLSKADEMLLFKRERKLRSGLVYDISCMEEEFRAWEEGYKLGKLLGIKINEKKWFELRSRCLLSYMKFYSNRY